MATKRSVDASYSACNAKHALPPPAAREPKPLGKLSRAAAPETVIEQVIALERDPRSEPHPERPEPRDTVRDLVSPHAHDTAQSPIDVARAEVWKPRLSATDLESLVGNAIALSHAVSMLAAALTSSASNPQALRAAAREAHARCVDTLTGIEIAREVLLARTGTR